MLSIVKIGDPALRKISKPISEKDLTSSTTKKLLHDLSETLNSRNDGVGLSAPQLGITKRVFVVAGKIFDKDWQDGKNLPEGKVFKDEYFLNPVIIKKSKKLSTLEEGCLSIPNVYGMVKRPVNVTIEYTNEMGEKKTRGASGLLARIFQHEIDHLDGILFIDKATDIKETENTNANQEY
ncbi:MAG: peptide deformylase [Bacteroidetes bacterium]|nr:peptide deformylase [Bacteroidota bacterium]